MIVEHLMEEEDMTTEIDMTLTEDETRMMIIIKSTLGEVKGAQFNRTKYPIFIQGTYRILSNGRDVEMTCEFPGGSHLISNVIWERSDRGYNNYRR